MGRSSAIKEHGCKTFCGLGPQTQLTSLPAPLQYQFRSDGPDI